MHYVSSVALVLNAQSLLSPSACGTVCLVPRWENSIVRMCIFWNNYIILCVIIRDSFHFSFLALLCLIHKYNYFFAVFSFYTIFEAWGKINAIKSLLMLITVNLF